MGGRAEHEGGCDGEDKSAGEVHGKCDEVLRTGSSENVERAERTVRLEES